MIISKLTYYLRVSSEVRRGHSHENGARKWASARLTGNPFSKSPMNTYMHVRR